MLLDQREEIDEVLPRAALGSVLARRRGLCVRSRKRVDSNRPMRQPRPASCSRSPRWSFREPLPGLPPPLAEALQPHPRPRKEARATDRTVLKDLQRDIRFWSAGLEEAEADPAALEKFKRRLDHILDESLKYWMKVRGAPELERAAEEAMPQVRRENAPHE